MEENLGTRTDCTRDNQAMICPNSSYLGFSTRTAKRGSWVTYTAYNGRHAARVIGRVTCERKTYLEVITTDTALTMAYVRWIDPADVTECYAAPRRKVLEFMMGPWDHAETILKTAAAGFADFPSRVGKYDIESGCPGIKCIISGTVRGARWSIQCDRGGRPLAITRNGKPYPSLPNILRPMHRAAEKYLGVVS